MKKYLFVASVMLALTACTGKSGNTVAADTEASASSTGELPVFKFDQETYNFGKISEGDKVTHEFKFKNTGTAPLIISDAMASCGCTVPEFPTEPIAPGKEGKIKVVFNSAGKIGKQNKVVTLTSNAEPQKTALYLVGEVLEKNK